MVATLSTHLGLCCRIDNTSTVVICTTEAEGHVEGSARKPETAGIRNQRVTGVDAHRPFPLRAPYAQLNTRTPRVPVGSRTGPAPQWSAFGNIWVGRRHCQLQGPAGPFGAFSLAEGSRHDGACPICRRISVLDKRSTGLLKICVNMVA